MIPNTDVFSSWSLDSTDITFVGTGTLTGMPLGKNVYVRPGSYLVKTPLSPNVYAIGEGGVRHWIKTEDIAKTLYGSAWNTRVIDLPETLLAQYPIGVPLTEAVYPEGSFVRSQGGSTWYIGKEGKRYSIGPETLETLDLSPTFLVTELSDAELAVRHPYEDRLLYNDSQRWPF